jgi:exodeoxyribonuclease VII small subunit
MSKPKPPEERSFEQAFEELDQLVDMLEAGEKSLEESLALFERGQALAERCTELLENAELRLRQLTPDDGGGYQETELKESNPGD